MTDSQFHSLPEWKKVALLSWLFECGGLQGKIFLNSPKIERKADSNRGQSYSSSDKYAYRSYEDLNDEPVWDSFTDPDYIFDMGGELFSLEDVSDKYIDEILSKSKRRLCR